MSLEQLRKKRSNWVFANRENGFEDGIKRLLTDLYPDNAHFIYELLQNAEDPHATTVRFTLNSSSVEFEHDGERLFALKDVDSITSIGASTKKDDPTSIGKFGVGFKAVFAYTNTPEIHSGDFHFRIHDLVVPETDGVLRPHTVSRETRFSFPFNNPKKPAKKAVEEVKRGLCSLGDNTLLFLSHIRKIEFLLPDGSLGSLERLERDAGRMEIRAIQPNGAEKISHWLRFGKNVEVVDEDGKPKTCFIALAFHLSEEKDKKGNSIWTIVPLEHGEVSIYFPAEKETSNLRFHIHAPFASTVARDSVRDCDANHQLRDQLARLAVESLTDIRDRGMLTVGFLGVLPNPNDNLPDFYEPIREAIVEAFNGEALTPMKAGGYVNAESVFRGPREISDVIDDEALALLLGDDHTPPLWVSNPPQRNQREDRFIESLDIGGWGWDELAEMFSDCMFDDEQREQIEAWICAKTDDQMLKLYALLGEAGDRHDQHVNASQLEIIRIATDKGDQHVAPSKAYFPPEDDASSLPAGVPFVKVSVYQAGRSETQKTLARSFLTQAGVRVYDIRAGIERILEQYPPTKALTLRTHIGHIRQFVRYWKQNPTDASLFYWKPFLVDSLSDGKITKTCLARTVCLDAPYEQTGLASLIDIHKKPSLWNGYSNELAANQLEGFVSFLKATGIFFEFEVKSVSTSSNPHRNELWKDIWARNTFTGIDEDYSIENIEKYLSQATHQSSYLIWHALIRAKRACSNAHYRPNKQYPTREAPSQLVCHLRAHSWIPAKCGEFRSPADMTREDLCSDFPYDDRNGLLTAIGFGENSKKRSEEYQLRDGVAQVLGFASAEVAAEFATLGNEGITPADVRSMLAQRTNTEQPKQSVPDPERRRKNVLANTEDAPNKESIRRERTIQKGISEVAAQARAYLRAKYKNEAGQLVCQCCHLEMPFRLDSGEHYFEAVQCINDKETRHFQNRLALCPTCAAMYQHARETDDAETRRRIAEHSADDKAPSVELTVRLAGQERAIRFVGTHWFDLKTILSVREP